MRHEEYLLPGRVAGTDRRPDGGSEDAARAPVTGHAIMADEIGQHRGPVVVLGRRVEQFMGPMAERLNGDRIFHVNDLGSNPQREAPEEMIEGEGEFRGIERGALNGPPPMTFWRLTARWNAYSAMLTRGSSAA